MNISNSLLVFFSKSIKKGWWPHAERSEAEQNVGGEADAGERIAAAEAHE
jgi:hypothetical protein